jgi:hypothetical protein
MDSPAPPGDSAAARAREPQALLLIRACHELVETAITRTVERQAVTERLLQERIDVLVRRCCRR